MIKTRVELKEYLNADRRALGMKYPLLASLTYGEHSRIRNYLACLRYTEYYSHGSGILKKLLYSICKLRLRKKSLKYGIYISPNCVGKGLNLPHPGFIRIDSFVRIGDNCTILPMVLFGRKRPTDINSDIVVGNNCYVSAGVTILGPVTIGDNVTIAAEAVVTKDIPNNAVVAGIPAKVVKYKI